MTEEQANNIIEAIEKLQEAKIKAVITNWKFSFDTEVYKARATLREALLITNSQTS